MPSKSILKKKNPIWAGPSFRNDDFFPSSSYSQLPILRMQSTVPIVMKFKIIIELFRIKAVEPIQATTSEERYQALIKAG